MALLIMRASYGARDPCTSLTYMLGAVVLGRVRLVPKVSEGEVCSIRVSNTRAFESPPYIRNTLESKPKICVRFPHTFNSPSPCRGTCRVCDDAIEGGLVFLGGQNLCRLCAIHRYTICMYLNSGHTKLSAALSLAFHGHQAASRLTACGIGALAASAMSKTLGYLGADCRDE